MRKLSLIVCSIVASFGLAPAQVPQTWNVAEQEKLLPPQWLSADDRYGRAVAISGDRIVIGAHQDDPYGTDSGAAYVFVRNGTTWMFEDRLLPPSATAGGGDNFGVAVDIDGSTIVVGAYLDNQSVSDSGAAYVYELVGGVWNYQATLTASNQAAGDGLGVDVAIDGDVIVCGAYNADRNGIDSGSAYVFLRSGGAWCQQFEIFPLDGVAGDKFGRAVDVSDDTIAVGAPFDHEFVSDEGSAYVFVRVDDATPGLSCGDTWAQQGPKLLNPNRQTSDNFGYSVALEGETLVVGAFLDDHDATGSPVDCGSFTIFDRVLPGPIWVVNAKVFASNNGVADYHGNDRFGFDVAIGGDTIVAGAYYDFIFGTGYVGSTYVYTRNQMNAWNQRLKVLTCKGAYDDESGVSVDVDADTLVVGAHLDDPAGTNSGSAYAFVFARDRYDTFCHGDGAGPACPCSNNSVAGAKQGCKNSLARGAMLRPGGSTLVAANDLELYACNIPGGNSCVLFGGTGNNAGLPFYAGLKCVPPPTVRLGLLASSSTGHVVWTNSNFPTPPWSPGETWYFQAWYRDPTFTGCTPAATTNLTNGVKVTFQ